MSSSSSATRTVRTSSLMDQPPFRLRICARARRGQRQLDDERRAVPLVALEHDRPAVRLHDRPADREAEPDPLDRALGRARGAVEALEQALVLRGGNADPRVLHLDPRTLLRPAEPHGDAPAGRRELDRVGDQVVDDLAQAVGIALDRRYVLAVDDELDLSLLGPRAAGRGGLAQHGTE